MLLFLMLVALATAGPLSHRRNGGCAKTCPNSNQPSTYAPGKSYTFSYETSMRTQIKGASDESTGLRLTSKIVLDVFSPCEMAMRMEGIKVSEQDTAHPTSWVESSHQSQFETELSLSDVHFAVQEGRIPEVCAEAHEPEWVLNIKKAVISLLQNTSPNKLEPYEGVETDISGKCKVTYKPALESGWHGKDIEVVKVTDLMSCLDQQHVRSSYQSSSYRVPAQIQSMPLTKANRTCKSVYYSGGNIKTVHCTEEHTFRPFSTESSGAIMQVEQTMEFIGAGAMVKVAHDHTFKRSQLSYQHHSYKLPSTQPLEDVKSALSDLCELGPAIEPQTPKLFNELIHRLRGLSAEQLRAIQTEVERRAVCRRNNQMARQFFLDALPVVSTPAAIELMKELVLGRKISPIESELWLTSLAFVQEPKNEMLESLRPLLEAESPSQQAQLGIGALVFQYCKGRTDCHKDAAVKNIGKALQRQLGKDCSTGDKKTLLTVLKAVGNAGYLTDLTPTLVLCAFREANLMDVRVAAIDALRRTPCSEDRTALMKLIRNKDIDSELRITAYLGLMTCPTPELLDTVKELLTAESSNQFASFMWTHLTNLLETSDPHKQGIRLIVEDVKLKKQYDMDKLKFSRNIEKSFFSKYLNAGAKLESNLIWSQRSFLPRSATLNMTLDLFGKSFNFLEVGGRVQGLETLLEKYLGPKGMERKQEADTSGQLAELDKTFKAIEDEIGGSLDIRIFGHQVAFLDLWRENLERSRNSILELLSSLKQMREVSWQKSFSFLDTQVTIPTISGFPLILGVNGTASIVIKSSGKLNVKLMQWPPEIEIEGRLSPSGTLHISGMLGIGTVYGDYGVKMVASVHSSTEMQAKIRSAKGEELQIEIQQPRERQSILNAKTSFFVIHRSIEREQKMRQDLLVKRKACSGENLMKKVLGIEFCAEIRYPKSTPQEGAPLAPMAAGFEMDLSMHRRDTHTSYLVHLINKKDGINRHWKVLVDTPGSQTDRKLLAEFLLDSANKKVEARLTTPWKKAKTTVQLTTEDTVSELRFSTEVDNKIYASAIAKHKRSETVEEVRYELERLELRFWNSRPVTMSGMLSSSKLSRVKKWEAAFKVDNLWTKPVAVSANVTYSATRAAGTASVESPIFNGKIQSNYDITASGLSGSTAVAYQIGDNPEETLKIQPSVKLTMSTSDHSLKASIKCVFSEFPHYNTHVALVSKRSGYSNHEMDVHLEYGNRGEFVRIKNKYGALQRGRENEHTFMIGLATNYANYVVQSDIVHDSDWTKVSAKLALSSKDDESSALITKVEFSRNPGTVFYTALIKSQLNEDSYGLTSKLESLPSGAHGFEAVLTLLDNEHSVKAELQQEASTHKIRGRVSLPGYFVVDSELNADTSSSEPSISAKLVTPMVAYLAAASAKFGHDDLSIQAYVSAPKIKLNTSILLINEADSQKLSAEIYWNPRRAQSDGIKIDGSMKVNRMAHSSEREGKLTVSYPAGKVVINLKENNEHLKSNKFVEMVYGSGKTVSANFMYDINDGWTEKGIVSMLRLVTPITRYEVITLKLEGYGSLRVRQLQIESSINDRRFKTELVVNLGNINNFHSRLSIVTPWAQASFIKFDLTHWLTSSEIKSTLDMEFKTKKVVLEIHGYNKGSYNNKDAGMKIKTESTFNWMPKVLIDVAHKDDGKQFSSNADIAWNEKKVATLQSKFNFYPQYDKIESRGNITLATAFKGYEALSAVWDHQSNMQVVSSSSKVTYLPGKTLELRLDAYNELTAQKDRQVGSSFSLSAPFMEEANFKASVVYGSSRIESNLEMNVPFVGKYQFEVLATMTGPRLLLKLETPHESLAKFRISHSTRKDSDMEASTSSEFKWNEKLIKLTTKLTPTTNDQMLEVILQTPFDILKHERLLMQATSEGEHQVRTFEFSHNLLKFLGVAIKTKTNSDGKEFFVSLESPFQKLQSLEATALYAWMTSEKAVKATITYNKQDTLSLDMSSLNAESQSNFNGKLTVQSLTGTKKLVLMHKKTTQQVTSQLTADAGSERVITIKSSMDVRGTFEIECSTPFAAATFSKVHASVSKENRLYKSKLVLQHIYHSDMLKVEMEGELGGFEKGRLEMRIASPKHYLGDAKVTLSHKLSEQRKWHTVFDASYPGGRIDAISELSLIAGEINGRWSIKTPFTALEELSLHLRHRNIGRLIEHQHGYKMIAAGNTIHISNSLRLLGLRNIKISSLFNSNILGVERIAINGHQTIEGSPLVYDGAFSIDYGTTTIAAGLDWKVESSAFESSSFVKLPLDLLKSFNVTVRSNFVDWKQWSSKGRVRLENSMGVLQFENDFSLKGFKDFAGSLKLLSPICNLAGSLQAEALHSAKTVLIQGVLRVDESENQLKLKLENANSGHYKASLKISDQPAIVVENRWQSEKFWSFDNRFTVLIAEAETISHEIKLQTNATGMRLTVSTKAGNFEHKSSSSLSIQPNKFDLEVNHNCNWMLGPIHFKMAAAKDTFALFSLSTSAILQTPYFADASGSFTVDLEHIFKGKSLVSINWPSVPAISGEATWNFLTDAAAKVEFQFPVLQRFSAKLTTDTEGVKITMKMPEFFSEIWELRALGALQSPARASLTLHLTTPLSSLRSISIRHSHNFEDRIQISSDVGLPGWERHMKLEFSSSLGKSALLLDGPGFSPLTAELFLHRQSESYEASLSTDWSPLFGLSNLELKTKLHWAPTFISQLDAKIPLTYLGYDVVRVKFEGDLQLKPTKNIVADLQYAMGSDEPLTQLVFITGRHQSGKQDLTVSIPIGSLTASHRYGETTAKLSWSSGGSIELRQMSSVASRQDFEVTASLKYKTQDLDRDMELHVRHQGHLTQFRNKVTLKTDQGSILDYSGHFDIASEERKTEFVVQTPITDQMTVRMGHRGGLQDFTHYLDIKSKFHEPFYYKGQFKDMEGDFSASVPVLGQTRMQIRRDGRKFLIAMSANAERVTIKVENAWAKMSGRTLVEVNALNQTMSVTLKCDGDGWNKFMAELSIQAADVLFDAKVGHEASKSVHFSTQLTSSPVRSDSAQPKHAFAFSGRRDGTDFQVDIQLVRSYETVFGLSAKHQLFGVFSVVVKTNRPGFQLTSLVGSLTESLASLEFTNDFTKRNAIKFEVIDQTNVKLVFDSDLFGIYSAKYRPRKLENSRYTVSMHPEIEIRWPNSEPVILRVNYLQSARSLEAAVHLATPFIGFSDNKLSLALAATSEGKMMSIRIDQENLGRHELSFKAKKDSLDLSGEVELKSEYTPAASRLTWTLSPTVQAVTFYNGVSGSVKFNGKVEQLTSASLTGSYTLEAPYQAVGTTSLRFEWLSNELKTKLKLQIKNPWLGENELELDGESSEEGQTSVKHTQKAAVYLERLNERFSLQSTFINGYQGSVFRASGSHSFVSSRFGAYSCAENVHIENDKMHASVTVHTPIRAWGKTGLSINIDTTQNLELSVQLETEEYGVHSTALRLRDNDLTVQVSARSVHQELKIAGWRLKKDQSGATTADFTASVNSPNLKASTRLELTKGHLSIETSAAGSPGYSGTARASATWEFKPKKVLLDIKAGVHSVDFDHTWSATCDVDLAHKDIKRLIVKLTSPLSAIKTTGLDIQVVMGPIKEVSVVMESPYLGQVKAKGLLKFASESTFIPARAKLALESSHFVPGFEAAFSSAQRHENFIMDLSVKNLATDRTLFKVDSLYDAFNQKLTVNFGTREVAGFSWQSRSDVSSLIVDERIGLIWNRAETFSVDAKYSWSRDRKVSFMVQTPFSGYEKFGVKLVGSVSLPLHLEAKLVLPSQELKTTLILDFKDGLHIRGALTLPNIPAIELALQAVGNLGRYNFELTTQYGETRYSAVAQWNFVDNLTAKIKLETPAKDLRLLEVYGTASEDEANSLINFGFALNEYSNEFKFSKTVNSKGLKFRLHCLGKLFQMELNRLGHAENRAVNILFSVDGQKQIDISTRLTSLFISRAWKIRPPHSGFVEIRRLFGSLVEGSRLEWDFARIGWHDQTIVLRADHKDSHFRQRVSLRDGQLAFKISASVPRVGIEIPETSGNIEISKVNGHDTQVRIGLLTLTENYQLVTVTNGLNKIHLHATGLKNLNFVKQDSLTLHAQLSHSDTLRELSLKVFGLQQGNLAAVTNVKFEKETKQATVGLILFETQFDAVIILRSRHGWFKSNENEFEGKLRLGMAAGDVHSISWSSKFSPAKSEADLQVQSSRLQEREPLHAKFVAIHQNGLHATAELSGWATRDQVQLKLTPGNLDLSVVRNSQEVINLIASYSKSGYKSINFSQRLHMVYMKQVVISFEANQDIASYKRQIAGSVGLQVYDERVIISYRLDVEKRMLDGKLDITGMSPVKLTADLSTFSASKMHIVYGRHEVKAHLQYRKKGEYAHTTELEIKNPWMPISVQLDHEHKAGLHRVQHIYTVGDESYKLNGHLRAELNSVSTRLHYKSPAAEMQAEAEFTVGAAHSIFSHTIQYNGHNYVKIDARMEGKTSETVDFADSRSLSSKVVTPFFEPVSVELLYHFNTNWKDSKWRHVVSFGSQKAEHSGRLSLSNREISSHFTLMDHVNELKLGSGHYLLRHTYGQKNVFHLSGTYSTRSSSLKFNSDLTGFHTDARLKHEFDKKVGSIRFAQSGSFWTPEVSGNWNLNRPTLRGELSIGEIHASFEHVHQSDKDFSCHYLLAHGKSKHEFKAGFAFRPTPGSEYHTEVDGHASIESTATPRFGLRIQHRHKDWMDHSCSAKLIAADWNLVHKSTMKPRLHGLNYETELNHGDKRLFYHQMSVGETKLTGEASFEDAIVYRIRGDFSSTETNINLLSDYRNIDSATKVSHDVQSWRQGKLAIAHSGLLPSIQASANWGLTGNAKHVYARLNALEIDLNKKFVEGKVTYRHRVDLGIGQIEVSGVFDPLSALRFTEANLRVTSHQSALTWKHSFGLNGQATLIYSHKDTTSLQANSKWDFASSKKTLLVNFPIGRLQLELDSATAGTVNVIATLPSGTHNLTGVLNASSTWKSGSLSLQSGAPLLEGNWNVEEQEKKVSLQVGSFKLNLQHTFLNRRDFSFSHKLSCESCLLSTVLPSSIDFRAAVTAAEHFRSGHIIGSLAMSNNSPMRFQAKWSTVGEEKVMEITAPMFSARLTHQHRSFTDFNFRHRFTVVSQTYSVLGGVKIEPPTEQGQRMKAYFNGPKCSISLSHKTDNHRRHSWNHSVQIDEWQVVAEGHQQSRISLQSGIIVHRAAEQLLTKNITWSPEKFEYEDSAMGVKYHHLKLVNTVVEKAVWFKSLYYHKIVGTGASFKRTCPTCYQLELRAASRDVKNLLVFNSELQVGPETLMANGNLEIPFGRVVFTNKIDGKLRSFTYRGSLETEKGKLALESEIRLESTKSAALKATLQHDNLVPAWTNKMISINLAQSGDVWQDMQHSVELAIDNWKPLLYNGRINLASARKWRVEVQLSEKLTPLGSLEILTALDKDLNATVRWREQSFVQLKANSSYSVEITSSFSGVPRLLVSLRPNLQPQKASVSAEIQYAEKTLQGNVIIDTGAQKLLQVEVKTPFSTIRHITTSISVGNKVSGKFSAHAEFAVNNVHYSTALTAEKESAGPLPQGSVSWRAETPHGGFQKLQFVALHKKNSVRVMAKINSQEFSLSGNVTAKLMSLRASLPIAGYEKIGLKVYHDDEEAQNRVRVLLKLPKGHYARFQAVGTIKLQGLSSSAINGTLQVETSFSGLKNAGIGLVHEFKDGHLQHTSSVVIDGQRLYRLSFNGSIKKGEISLERTNPIRVYYRLGLSSVRIVEIKVMYKDTVPFHLNTEVQKGDYSISGKSFLTVRTPYRTVVLTRELKVLPKGFTFKLEFTPDQQTIKPLAFTVYSLDKSDYSKKAVSVTVMLNVPTRRIEASLELEKARQEGLLAASLNWDAGRSSSDKVVRLKLKSLLTPGKKIAGRLELQVANKKPYAITLTTLLNERQVLFSNRLELDITDNQLDTIVLELQGTRTSIDTLNLAGSLFQDSGKVNLKLQGQLKTIEGIRDCRVSLEYLGTDGQQKKMESVVRIGSDGIRLEMTSPTRKCNFELIREQEIDSTVYTLNTHGKTFQLQLRSNNPDIELVYQPRYNDRVSVAVGYPNNRHLRIDIHRTTDQVKMQHLLAEVQLKSRHLLKTRVHWNPTYAMLHYSTLKHRMPSMYKEVSGFINSVRFSCVQDLFAKLSTDLVMPDMGSAAQFVSEELQPLRRDLSYLSSQVEQMYMRNEFYSQEIYLYVQRTASAVKFYASAAISYGYDQTSRVYNVHVHPHVRHAVASSRYYAGRVHTAANEHYAWCHSKVSSAYGVYRNHTDRVYVKVNQHALRYISVLVDGIRPALDAVHSGIQSVISAYSKFHSNVIGHPLVQRVHSRVVRSISYINFQSLSQIQSQLQSSVVSTHHYVESKINMASEHTASVIGSAKSHVTNGLNKLLENRHAQLASSLVSGAYEQSKWFLDHFNIEQGLKDFGRDNYLQAVEYLRQNSIDLATDYLGVSKNKLVEKNFDQGRFEADLYSPMAWNDLQSMPTSGLEETLNRLSSSYKSLRNSYNGIRRKLLAVRDVVYDSIPDFDMPSGSWMPKFKGVASVIGNHVITFDGHHYDFRGSECSYLLARDFRGRGWGISLSYSRSGKSMNIYAYSKRITLTPRLHVLVDGAPQELPLSIGNLSIVRTASGLHVKDLGHMFTVFVDSESDSHMVSVSGWYHGRLGGLLGNFDNEPFNDLTGSDGKRTDDLLSFTNSWKLGNCRHTNLASGGDVPKSPHPECERLFGSPRSPFKRCYTYVNPAPFLEICAQERRSSGGQQMCKAVVVYMRHCAAKGLRGLQAPAQCMRCDIHSGAGYRQLLVGQKDQLSTTGTAADVVLVLEERGCLGKDVLRSLPTLVSQMELSLRKAGINSIRYSLLGFGNPAHHYRGNSMATRGRAHWHTMGGELTGTAEQLAHAITTIDTHDTAEAGAEIRADALDAVRLAVRFPELRQHAARHVILVTCDECHEGRRTVQSVRRDLAESGVQLHLMAELQLPTYFYGRRSQAFGVDIDKAYSAAAPNGSVALHGYTLQPAGKCTQLAKATGGSAFDLKYLRRRQYSGLQALQFVRAFAGRLAAVSARPAAQECRCAASACGQRSRLRCRPRAN